MPMSLHSPVLRACGLPLLEAVSAEPARAAVTAAAAASALPLCSRQILKKRSHAGPGASRASIPGKHRRLSHVGSVVPEEVMQPPSGFGSARRKVSCYSLGMAGFRAPGRQPVPEPQQKGQQEIPSCAHTACCLPCFVHNHPGPTKGPAKPSQLWPLASPVPLLQLTSGSDYKHLFPFARTLWGPAVLLTSYAWQEYN